MMQVTEFNRIDSNDFLQLLKRVKKWIGIRGVWLIRRYIVTASEGNKELILSKVSILTCRYSLVMTFRLIMLDIKQQHKHQITDFVLSPSDEKYIHRQLLRFIGVNKIGAE